MFCQNVFEEAVFLGKLLAVLGDRTVYLFEPKHFVFECLNV